MSDLDSRVRFDSWKAIADYLRRDVATARRWEQQGLPVRRIAGARGRSVFAYRDEIDAWLDARPETPAAADLPAPPPRHTMGWKPLAVAFVLLAITVGAGWRFVTAGVAPADLRVSVSGDAIVARDNAGNQRWRHTFPVDWRVFPPRPDGVVAGGDDPAVYVTTGYKERQADSLGASGELLEFGLGGRQQRSFAFDDEVSFGGKPFGPPWAITAYSVGERDGQRRIAVAAHHYTWSPSLVTILDDRFQRRGTFAHAGWIESVNWLGEAGLLIGGFSEQQNGGMVARLDPAALDGQGPETPGTPSYCDACGSARPLVVVVMPRSEVNRASASPFNRAIVQIVPGRVLARTVEMPTLQYGVDAIYEFDPSLELLTASFSARYWEMHRSLEQQGTLDHPRERCPDRDGPPALRVWDPAHGWTTKQIRVRSTS